MSHWLDAAARGLATGRQTRRQVLRRGGAVAAVAMFDSLIKTPHAIAGTTPCPMLPCPSGQLCCAGAACYDPQSAECCTSGSVCAFDQGVCCEGRCLTTGEFGCCHDRLYRRPGQQCCPDAPRGGTHTCLDDQVCCGKDKCCQPDEVCCGTGQCIPSAGGRVGCCNGFTYHRRTDKCCPDHKRGDFHVCANTEECCGKDKCCQPDEVCCGTGQCIPSAGGRVGCCNGFTYHRRTDKCCPDHKPGDFHVCAKNEQCCGDSGCCKKGEVCCGTGPGATCCKMSDCNNGVCGGVPGCNEDFCKPLVTNSGMPWQCCPTSPSWTCYNPEIACCVNNVVVEMCGTTCCEPGQGECCTGPGGTLVCCG